MQVKGEFYLRHLLTLNLNTAHLLGLSRCFIADITIIPQNSYIEEDVGYSNEYSLNFEELLEKDKVNVKKMNWKYISTY